ncbi:hypothetical protein M011DRAFT_485821 [Sporormia fimetaria CBS 119925]|uniref:BZIP domain-containing protein n=1 Tax=Sporormia fimetaria CBS 119925 TaxID=1340428 RepID=A0A6A6VEE3_9PLEO|nr:hypothetical protein M011DRAFT_485821 [Sporormia fimetaria CBS 119925]
MSAAQMFPSELRHQSHMFAQTMTTPAFVALNNRLTPPPSIDLSGTTVKMEDLTIPQGCYATPPPQHSLPPTSNPTPPASDSSGKPVKKRKSWGQVLPEPKTNLPPRKRAKTEDEKEQRRIERVKRNRLAAHNSRERKRQEVELLQREKDKVQAEKDMLCQTLQRFKAHMTSLQEQHPDIYFGLDQFDLDSHTDLVRETTETINPRQTSFPSPISIDIVRPAVSVEPSVASFQEQEHSLEPLFAGDSLQQDDTKPNEDPFSFIQLDDATDLNAQSLPLFDSQATTDLFSEPLNSYGLADGFDLF